VSLLSETVLMVGIMTVGMMARSVMLDEVGVSLMMELRGLL